MSHETQFTVFLSFPASFRICGVLPRVVNQAPLPHLLVRVLWLMMLRGYIILSQYLNSLQLD